MSRAHEIRSSTEVRAGESSTTRIAASGPLLVMHWGRAGGGPRFAVRMAEALRGAWPAAVYSSFHADAEIVNLRGHAVSNELPVSTYRSVWGLVFGAPRILLLGVRLRRLIKRRGVTTVYSAMSSLWQSVCTSVFLPRRVLFLASIHDATEHPGEQHWALRFCRSLELRRADVIVVHSAATKAALLPQIARRGTPVVVVPHGADAPTVPARRLDPSSARPLVLGFVGRIVEYKGLDLFVDLIRRLHEQGMAVHGIVAGRGDVPPGLVEATRALIDWRIGWIPEKELEQVMAEIDVLVLPYREASQSGVHALALSAGVPSIATPVGGLVEQLRDSASGVVAAAVSVEALAAAVRELIHTQTYARASENALAAASGTGSWEHAASRLVQGLNEPR